MYLHDADWQPEFFRAELVLEVAEGTDSPQRHQQFRISDCELRIEFEEGV